jgi:hypothetical protein
MIVPQAEIDEINGKARRRIMRLPAKHGKFGELKRCPMRPGGVYRLRPPIPYDRCRTIAERQPTRARTILRLYDLCERHPVRYVAVTVFAVVRQEDEWLIRFIRGEDRSLLDRPVYLAKYGDYTMTASKQAVPGDPELLLPLAEDLAKARAKALESRVSPQRQLVSKISADVDTLRGSLEEMGKRNRLRRVEHDLKALARELSSADAIDCSTTIAGDGPHTDVARHERLLGTDSGDADADVVLATLEAA